MAYSFNGTNQTLNMASAPATTWPLTMACWFYTSDITNNGNLMSLSNSGTNGRFILSAGGAFAGDPVRTNAVDNTNTAFSVNTTTGYSANTWTHAAGVHPSNSSRTAYINGGSSATDVSVCGTLSGINIATLAGQRTLSGPTYALAQIAEVGIWNTALTAAEIASLAKGMTCDKVRPQSLVFYAPLVRDLIDQKGGLTITNNNSATVANHTRVYA
jgi:hypothetical protein